VWKSVKIVVEHTQKKRGWTHRLTLDHRRSNTGAPLSRSNPVFYLKNLHHPYLALQRCQSRSPATLISFKFLSVLSVRCAKSRRLGTGLSQCVTPQSCSGLALLRALLRTDAPAKERVFLFLPRLGEGTSINIQSFIEYCEQAAEGLRFQIGMSQEAYRMQTPVSSSDKSQSRRAVASSRAGSGIGIRTGSPLRWKKRAGA
jgi:hypothetical protein